MTLLALGINHKTAPISLRERIVFSSESLKNALNSLHQNAFIQSGVLLSTCNRTELYLSVIEQHNLKEKLFSWLCSYHGIMSDELKNSVYWHHECEVVNHLMRVTSGLDSQVIGEPQIFGQVKKAYAESKKEHILTRELERLFQKSFSVAKKIRTETTIGENAVSIAFMACSLAKQIFDSLNNTNVLLVGAGETIQLVARHLYHFHVKQIMVANRTLERAVPLVEEVNGKLVHLSELDRAIEKADIIISSTASNNIIIKKQHVEHALKVRRNHPMLLIDLAVPRDIAPEIAQLSDAYLYSIDDLHSIIQQNMNKRAFAAMEAEFIIQQEAKKFMAWIQSQAAVKTIRDYHLQVEKIREDIAHKALLSLKQGGDVEQIVQQMTKQLTNRLIHAPTKSLNEAASKGDLDKLSFLRNSLGLE